ncbi:DUF4214 domain-containing protein [Halomonas sp. H10-9-1]|uniref:DUF4214 domain-containing protein n=1 Tax=Halomonas sp. H10-9-1 TaxID=2950871 RepID=UPI0032DE835B
MQFFMPSTASLQTVQTLYIAYYGRPADPKGLQFWADQLDQADGDLTAILEDFGNSSEFIDAFGELDPDSVKPAPTLPPSPPASIF